MGDQWEWLAESRLWAKVRAGLGKGVTSWVVLTLPRLGRPSAESPANFLCSASHSMFLASVAISPTNPTPTLEMAGRRGVLQRGRQCQRGNLEAHGPLGRHLWPGHKPRPGVLGGFGFTWQSWVRRGLWVRSGFVRQLHCLPAPWPGA